MSRTKPLFSIILVTMRPAFLPGIRAMMDRQNYCNTELVVALHGHKASELLPEERRALECADVVIEHSRAYSLGHCLNTAIDASHGAFLAKIDDDDLYGENYLSEAMTHLLAGDGDIVGKAETYIYLEESGAIILRRPGAGLKAVKYVAGPTLAFSRDVALQHKFPDITLREDACFLEDCRAAGKRVFSTSRRHFMYVRRAATDTHTAPCSDAVFMEGAIVLRERRNASSAELLALIEDAGT